MNTSCFVLKYSPILSKSQYDSVPSYRPEDRAYHQLGRRCVGLHAMIEVPQAARKAVRPLSHCDVVAREVACGAIGVGIAEQDNQVSPQVSAQVALIEIETAHSDRVIDRQIGQHVPAAVRGYSRVDGGTLVSAR